MRTALEIFGVIVISYFAALNLIYLCFTVSAWQDISGYLRARVYAGADEAFASPLTPGISVLLPAFNEETGIVESVRSLLNLRYPEFEIVVVNDGSTDSTLERLRDEFDLVPIRKALRDSIACEPIRATYISRRHPKLVVIDKENGGGKADAMNAAIRAARHPYFCAVDADALLEEDALLRVAKPVLDDPKKVVATGGIVRIVNGCEIENARVVQVKLPRSNLASLQVVEYFRAFLVGRVAWSRMRSLLIISGAFGLFQRSVVESTGGYWKDTLGEDAELVVRMHRYMLQRGEEYRIEFVPDPVCWTEAPEDFRSLGGQRRRWQRGLMEALWRHRKLIGNPRFGLVGVAGLPYFALFEVAGPLVELVSYFALPVAFALGAVSFEFLLAFFTVAVLLGVLLSLAALALEEFSFRRHPRNRDVLRMVMLGIGENFGYRQLLTLWRVRAFFDLPRRRSWGVMERRGLGQRDAAEVGEEQAQHPA